LLETELCCLALGNAWLWFGVGAGFMIIGSESGDRGPQGGAQNNQS